MLNLSDQTTSQLVEMALSGPGQKTWWITRLAMYKALQNTFSSFDNTTTECLAISHSEQFGRDVLGLKRSRFVSADYPKCNILDLQFNDAEFDFCISDQVLEHIHGNPFKAFSETARVIKPGGLICHTTCFINVVHGAPSDFWRFTPDALKLMAEDSGLEVKTVGGWGNREAQGLVNSKYRFHKIPEDPKNPIYQLAMRNEPDYPVVTWIVARKPM